jgi:predicted metal-binding protein
MDRYLRMALKGGMDHALVIDPSKVSTEPWVRVKCRFGCHRYGRSHCCPPHTPTPAEMRDILDSYERAILLHRNWKEPVSRIDEFNRAVVDLELALFLDGYHKAWSVGSGPCLLCQKCNYPDSCAHAAKARPSMEACGIDVFKTVRQYDLPIRVLTDRTQERHSYGLVLVE